MDKLIKDYDVALVEPGCAPGSGRWGAQAVFPEDISAVFPYLNAVIADAWYYPLSEALIWGYENQRYALRPTEILVARVRDLQQAHLIISEVVDKINRVWQERESITPRFSERKLPAVIDILKLLPMTNCKRCGYPTCMAFAADLRRSKAQLEQCLPVTEPEYAEKKAKLVDLIPAD